VHATIRRDGVVIKVVLAKIFSPLRGDGFKSRLAELSSYKR
jgi:hypothetical protein